MLQNQCDILGKMSELRQERLMNLSSIESAAANPPSDPTKGQPQPTRLSPVPCHVNIRSPTISNASSYGSNFTQMNFEADTNVSQSSHCLDILTKMTDMILVLGAITIMISLCIVFLIVVLALINSYSRSLNVVNPTGAFIAPQTNTIEKSSYNLV